MEYRCCIVRCLGGLDHSKVNISACIFCRKIREDYVTCRNFASVCKISIVADRYGPGQLILGNFITGRKVRFPSKFLISPEQSGEKQPRDRTVGSC